MAGFDFHLPEATTPTGPLAGCHVLVTRPALAASRTATRLAALGATPYIVPMLIIEAPADPSAVDAAWATLGDCVAAIFVSPSAVEMSFAPFGRWPPRRMPEGVRVLAPGPGTAEALAAVGVDAVGLPEQDFDSEGMLALPELQEANVRGRRIVIFRGDDGRELLRETLGARGARVDVVTAYHRRAPTTPPDGLLALLRSGRLNAISVMSGEVLSHLVALVPAGEREATLFAQPLYASHPRIAEAARQLGFLDVFTTDAGDAGLIAALLSARAGGGGNREST